MKNQKLACERENGENMNIRNFRDISGYKNQDGKIMKKNMIFRGGALNHITHEQAEYLENILGVRYILDFRDEKEAEMAKDYSFSLAYYEQISALRVQKHNDKGFDFENIVREKMDERQFQHILEYLKEGYQTMAFGNPAYQRLFELMLKNDGNIYFHCTAGKDRTGIAGFLIMIALGMDEKDAVNEYLLSNRYLKQGADDLARQLNIPEEYRRMCEPLLGVQEEFICLTIDAIKRKYIDYDNYLENEFQLDREKRNRLIEIYCE